MQQFLNNRYVQLAGLTLGLAILFFLVIWVVSSVIGLKGFPLGLEVVVAVLGAGIIVYKFFSNRIF